MSEPVVIDGWTCRVVRGQRSAQNYDLFLGAWLLPDGRLKTTREDGSDYTEVTVPPAVLAWLIRPLLREAWESGACHAVEEAPVDDWSTRKVDAVYAANPHKDP